MTTTRRSLAVLAVLVAAGALVQSLRAEEEPLETTPAFWLAKAEKITRRIEHPEGRAALLVSIGTGWVEAGEHERARRLLASAVTFGRRCRGCISKARRLAEVGLLQHRAGDLEGAARTFGFAREACNELDGALRIQARAYLAQQWQAAGSPDAARSLFATSAKAAGLLQDLERAEALAALADAESAAGNFEQAARVRGLLAETVKAIGPDARPILDASLLLAATAEMDAGRLDQAEASLVELEDLSLAVSGYAYLARKDHNADDPEGVKATLGKALAIAPAILDPVARVDAFGEIARAAWTVGAASQGRVARAGLGKATKEIEDLGLRVEACLTWVDQYRTADDVDLRYRALQELGTLLDEAEFGPGTGDRLHGLLAVAEARAGRFDRAERRAARVTDPVRRARVQLDIADERRKAEMPKEARTLTAAALQEAATWDSDRQGDQGEVMRQAAVLQAACGDLEAAAKIVDAIEVPFHAATACTYIARDLT